MRRFSPTAQPPDPLRAQSIAEILNRPHAFAALRDGVEQITAIKRDLTPLLPDYLTHNVEPGFIKNGTLTLFIGHSALAARLRQIEPRLMAQLQQKGWAVHIINARVRPRAMTPPPPTKQARMTAVGVAALHALSSALSASPLKTALTKMAMRHSQIQASDNKK